MLLRNIRIPVANLLDETERECEYILQHHLGPPARAFLYCIQQIIVARLVRFSVQALHGARQRGGRQKRRFTEKLQFCTLL